MIRKDDVYPIGRITKAHGLNGEVVFMFNDDIFDRNNSEYLIIEIDGILVPFFFEEYRFKSDSSALVKFEDINSVEKAQQLLGCEVFYERYKSSDNDNDLNKVNDDDINNDNNVVSLYYFIGFTIKDGEMVVGKIAEVNDSTENWLFITEDGTLIPANEDLIIDIDYDGKVIVMDLPEGLLNL
ncbi:MAG: 16S rRNA processing protein RimM [Bacteroidaceae bacterium]|nr:16S rRNA processing protein RimM [Bacteroidaceae bacterium]